jgi:hypothetical protein
MSTVDECRERADKCRALAEAAMDAEHRTRWLGMAQFWAGQARAKAGNGAAAPQSVSELIGQLCAQVERKS